MEFWSKSSIQMHRGLQMIKQSLPVVDIYCRFGLNFPATHLVKITTETLGGHDITNFCIAQSAHCPSKYHYHKMVKRHKYLRTFLIVMCRQGLEDSNGKLERTGFEFIWGICVSFPHACRRQLSTTSQKTAQSGPCILHYNCWETLLLNCSQLLFIPENKGEVC